MKISGKVAVGVLRDCQKFSRDPYIERPPCISEILPLLSHPTSSLPQISPCFPGSRWMAPWATKSEGVGLIIRAITFQDFQPMWSQSTNVTDRQTGRRHAITIVHRVAKMILLMYSCYQISCF